MENQPKTAAERAVTNKYLLANIRRTLILRQPGNKVFENIVLNLSNEKLVEHWLKAGQHWNRRRDAKAEPLAVTVL